MKALVKYGLKEKMVELREVPEPEIGEQDVLLEVKAAGVCGSDIEMWHHKVGFHVNVPIIQGHEFCGIIQDTGPGVKEFKPGDRVVSETASYICGKCGYCRKGEYNLCPDRKGFGAGVDGCFTRYVKVPDRILHKIPENVSFDYAALTEPASVAYNAIFIKSRIKPGEAVVVIGPGPIGLFAVQMARIGGAYPIVLVGTDVDKNRLETGKKIGADYIINVSRDDAVKTFMEMTGGSGASLVVDAAGNNAALKTAFEIVSRSGQITRLGWDPRPVNMSLDILIAKAISLQGSFSHTWSSWEAVLQLVSSSKLMMEPMITHRFPLDKWEDAFELMDNKSAVKALIYPTG
ncbi:MAG: zinc-binding dehydrogenase [Clostridiales bacterium]|nr:zinc-binding dehydrogenase [Clostridiales bacterium]